MSFGKLTEEQAEILRKRYYFNPEKIKHVFTSPGVVGVSSDDQRCLHKACRDCGGTGMKATGGMCFHGISCPCKNCSVSC